VRTGRRLFHHPRRRAAALHPPHRQPRHRHRLARRLDHGEVVPGASQGELPLHPLRRDLRPDAQIRRVVLARRRPAPRLDRRRQRPRAVRRAGDARRADQDRVGQGLPGDDRRPRPRADAQDQDQHGQAAQGMRRGAVLHAGAADHRHRAGLRPHHLGHRRRHDRLVRLRDALLRDAEGASRPARPRRRQGRRHHLQDRGARLRLAKGHPAAQLRDDALSRARFDFRWRTSSTSASIPTPRALSTTRRCRRKRTRSRISARCAARNSAR
jgi:hypothetical protein